MIFFLFDAEKVELNFSLPMEPYFPLFAIAVLILPGQDFTLNLPLISWD